MSFTRRFSGTLQLLLLLVSLAACAFCLLAPSQEHLDPRTLGPGDRLLFRGVLVYLIFLFARASVVMFLSLAERFFNQGPSTRPAPQAWPLVSVIVPCYNESLVIDHALGSLARLDYPALEILVIDDGSKDTTCERALAFAAAHPTRRIRVIHQTNGGKPRALNRGIREAAGDFVLCVDADSILEPDAIKQGMRRLLADPGAVAVAGNVRVGNRGSLLAAFQRLEYIGGLNFHKQAQSFLGAVTIIPGPAGLFRRASILEAGGYRSSTFAEDCELTVRLLLRGGRVIYCPGMTAVTEAPEDFHSLLKQRYRWARGTLQVVRENAGRLLHPGRGVRGFAIVLYFFAETVLIPAANCFLVLVLVQRNLESGSDGFAVRFLTPYFLQLTLLDFLIYAFCLVGDRFMLPGLLLALLNRMTYGLATEVLRIFSMLDELLRLPMGWNKLQRTGALEARTP